MDEEDKWLVEVHRQIDTVADDETKCLEIVRDSVRVRHNKVFVYAYNFSDDRSGYQCEVRDYSTTPCKITAMPLPSQIRRSPALSALPNGRVAMFGGFMWAAFSKQVLTCEAFDARTGSFSDIEKFSSTRDNACAVLLHSGLVFIIGGASAVALDPLPCMFYDPVNDEFSESNAHMLSNRKAHTASVLQDGRVLVCGGSDDDWNMLQSTEIYDPVSDTFSAGPPMCTGHGWHSAVTLSNGKVLICDTWDHNDHRREVELYDPETNSFSLGPSTTVRREDLFVVRLPDDRVLISGGVKGGIVEEGEIYDPVSNTITLGEVVETRKSSYTAVSF